MIQYLVQNGYEDKVTPIIETQSTANDPAGDNAAVPSDSKKDGEVK